MAAPFEGIIVPTLTPMDIEGECLDLEAARNHVMQLVESGVNALFLAGTTGEGPLLSAGERKAYTEAVLTVTANALPIVVQVGAATTRESVRLAEHAAQQGASAVACLTPYYIAASARELEQHALEVARAVAPLDVYLYNIPARTGNAVTPPLAERLAREPNIVGIKDSTGEMAQLLDLLAIPNFRVVIGADALAVPSFQAGAVGMVSGPAGVFPEPYAALWRAWKEGAYEEALSWQGVVLGLSRAVHHGARIDLLKALGARRWGGMGNPRPPLLPPPNEELTQVCTRLRTLLQKTALPEASYAWL